MVSMESIVPSSSISLRALLIALVRPGLSLETATPYCSPVGISTVTSRSL